MSTRPSYRSFYVSFWDDPDQTVLSDRAYRVLTTLKGTLPAAGISIVLPELLASRCACTRDELEFALTELEQAKPHGTAGLGWIVREGAVIWLVNGLRYEPTIRATDPKHRAFVADCLMPLGGADSSMRIVRLYREHYPEWFPAKATRKKSASEPPHDPKEGSREGSPQGSKEGSREALNQPITKTRLDQPATRARVAPAAAVDVTPIANAPSMAYLARCVVALNLGMQQNPNVIGAREIPATSQSGQVDWERDGIHIETVESVIAEVCARWKPRPGEKQINGLKYLDAAVRERHKQLVESGDVARAAAASAKQIPGVRPNSPERIAWLRKQGYEV